jgi:hypothetical protein
MNKFANQQDYANIEAVKEEYPGVGLIDGLAAL